MSESNRIILRLSQDLHQEIKLFCLQNNLSMQEWIMTLIKGGLATDKTLKAGKSGKKRASSNKKGSDYYYRGDDSYI